MTEHRIVGKGIPRIDASSKVSGRFVYGADFAVPGMLHGKVLRSPYPHARIVKLDTSAAESLPGVVAVVTAADVPTERFGAFVKDIDVFAKDTVRFKGHAVAAVAANSAEAAEQALALIDVEYEKLPFVRTIDDALREDAPLVHENWDSYECSPAVIRDRNVCNRARLVLGDVDAAFETAAHVYEDRFESNMVHPGYTEPRAAVAEWDRGKLTVWCNTQLPFEQQTRLADIFAINPSDIRVSVPGIGGGFGGKLRLGAEHLAAVLAKKARRPVKVVMTCEEEITTGYVRQPTIIELKTAVDKDGRIVAKKGRIYVDCGAMSGSGPGVASSCIIMLSGPYDIPNLDIEGIAVYTNKAPTGSFRAPSGPQGNFAVESQMDMIARRIGMDPLEFRLKNAVQEGQKGPSGQLLEAVSIEECLRKAAAAIGWNEPREPGRGKAIACGWWTMTGGSSGVYLKVNPDGQVVMNTGCVELGTGAVTGAVQVLAEALGVDVDDISVISGDTASTPYDFGAQGSRTAAMVGNACRDAVEKLSEKAFPIVAKVLGVEPDTLSFGYKEIVSGEKSMPLAEVAAICQAKEGGLIAHGTFIAPTTAYDPSRGKGMVIPVINSPSYHAHAVDLSVDPDSGEIKINKYVVVQDVGFAINPTYIEGQIEGGVVQGLGQAMFEEVVYNDGVVQNPNLTDYKMPTAADVPDIESILVECPGQVGPYGAKGVGEPPVIEPPAAIANAVEDACGARINALPITAEKIAKHLLRGKVETLGE